MNRLRLLGITLLPLLCLLATASAQAQGCRAKISDISRIEPSPTDYEPYDDDPPAYAEFSVDFQNGSPCTVVVGIDDGRNGTRVMEDGGERLAYELYKDASLKQRVNDVFGEEGGLFVATLDGKKDSQQFQLFSRVLPGQLVSRGTYTDQVRFNIYEVRDGVRTGPVSSQTVQVRTRVRDVVQAAVVVGGNWAPLAGTAGVLDLGNLAENRSGSFSLEVLGNGDYDLVLESENRGQLSAPGLSSGIAYQLSVDGRSMSLSSPVTLRLGGKGVQRYELVVSVPSVDRALAGTYRDNLVLTVTAR